MARKRKGSSVQVTMCNSDGNLVSSGLIILCPEIRVVGSFDECFAKLWSAYASEKIADFILHDLARYLPKADSSFGEEVQENA